MNLNIPAASIHLTIPIEDRQELASLEARRHARLAKAPPAGRTPPRPAHARISASARISELIWVNHPRPCGLPQAFGSRRPRC
jgi:hypothetical protein